MGSGLQMRGDRILLYGTGKIGKSTLASYLPAPYFLDVEASTTKMDVRYDVDLRHAPTWPMLRGKIEAIAQSPPKGMRSVVIDTVTVVEELIAEFVIGTRKTEKGKPVDSLEGYGWGKGWKFLSEEFSALLDPLDRIAEAGINVCLVAHECASPVPNPYGEDFIRWEPSLYDGDKKGRGSIRARLKNWADHILFVGYDMDVEEGKARGSGTRTVYTQELPTHMAGSRTKQGSFVYTTNDPGAVWRELGIS